MQNPSSQPLHNQDNMESTLCQVYNPPLLAAWNAATYVAQIDDEQLREAMSSSDYLDATWDVLKKHSGLWFTDESFIVARE